METFDFIVVGAGSSGCIVAARLADSGASVCLLEAGPMDRKLSIQVPGGVVMAHTDPSITWDYQVSAPGGEGKRPARHGRVVGGSGSINGMMINRGIAADYDAWAAQGNRGWRYADVLPYFRRMEQRIGPGDARYRGRSGALPVADADWRHPLAELFREAALGTGLPRDPDHNGPSQDGVSTQQLNLKGGLRVSAARAFLHPALKRHRATGRLALRTGALALQVLFEGRRAVGVRYALDGNAVDVHARREVILCAGAAASPKLLQVSGVGPPQLLGELGVPVVQALEGVGNNLQDHYHVRMVFGIRGIETINSIARGPRLAGEVLKWLTGRPGLVGSSPFPVLATVRSAPGLAATDVMLFFSPGSYTATTRKMTPTPGASCVVWQMRPASRGRVRARSSDARDLPDIDPNYLASEADRQALLGGIRVARRIFAQSPLAEHVAGEEVPGASADSDEALLAFARASGNTAFHLSGSCRMGPANDAQSVVDAELRVHGIEALRVCDTSIMPAVTSGNTNAPTMMIAEKAADMILGLPAEPTAIL